MQLDLLAGAMQIVGPVMTRSPAILIFDSGLGGLTVFPEIVRARPDARFVYAADDAAFPYGAFGQDELVARISRVMERLLGLHRPDLVVIACNTASTLVLPELRRRFDIPFVGTVPAIKPAASLSRSKRFSVLATPGTVARDYTRSLVEAYAGSCRVELVGSKALAGYAEAEMRGAGVPDAALVAEIAPCFASGDDGRTDVVVLACTHYPLLLERFRRLAPWPVAWIDPAPAVARRVVQILGECPPGARLRGPVTEPVAVFTGGAGLDETLRAALAVRGLGRVEIDAVPLARAGLLT